MKKFDSDSEKGVLYNNVFTLRDYLVLAPPEHFGRGRVR